MEHEQEPAMDLETFKLQTFKQQVKQVADLAAARLDAATLMDQACTTYIHGITPELTGEDEGVDMRDQPDHDGITRKSWCYLDANGKIVSEGRSWVSEKTGCWGSSETSSMFKIVKPQDQPDRVGSEGAD